MQSGLTGSGRARGPAAPWRTHMQMTTRLLLAATLIALPALSQAQKPSIMANQFFSGTVIMDDGGPVPFEKVIIESNCGGAIRQETTANSKGAFSFTLGKGSGNVTLESNNRSASSAATTSNVNPANCSVRATLAGYFSNVVYLGSLDANSPNMGALTLRKAVAAAPGSSSALSAAAPKDARKALDKGMEQAAAGKPADAVKNFDKAVQAYPAYAEALTERGKARAALNQPEDARKDFEAAIKADPAYTPPLRAIAEIENKARNWKGMAEYTGKILAIAPAAHPDVYLADSLAHFRLQEYPESLKSALEGIRIDKDHREAKLHELAAYSYVSLKQAAGALEQFKLYIQYAQNPSDGAAIKQQIADIEKALAQSKK